VNNTQQIENTVIIPGNIPIQKNGNHENISPYLLICFNLFSKLDAKSLNKVIIEIGSMELAKALKNADTALIETLIKSLPQKTAGMLLEGLEYSAQTTEEESKKCKENIVSVVRRLEKAGEIIV
jgi:flagellar motor switch protein FliG